MAKISVVMIVQDEEKKIEATLKSIVWADEILIVDGGSKDKTVEIASRYTSKILTRKLDTFADQKNFAIEQATGDWILSLDADEVVTHELELSLKKLAEDPKGSEGFLIRRANYLFGRRFKFGGQSGEWILRFFRKGKGSFEQPIHEKLVINGPVGKAEGELLHFSSSNVDEYLGKMAIYTDLEARFMKSKGMRAKASQLYIKPVLRFFYFYILKGGFLDGYEGFVYHVLSSYYYFFKFARLKELTEYGIE